MKKKSHLENEFLGEIFAVFSSEILQNFSDSGNSVDYIGKIT